MRLFLFLLSLVLNSSFIYYFFPFGKEKKKNQDPPLLGVVLSKKRHSYRFQFLGQNK